MRTSARSRLRTSTLVAAAISLSASFVATDASAGKPSGGSGPATWSFAGYTWAVKAATRQMGPGPNTFSAANVSTDSTGALHLRIAHSGRTWSCAEVILDHTLGYGTYEWTVRGPIDQLDPNVVLGLFTWEDSPSASPTNREIDVEAARWGSSTDPTNAQYVVQPAATASNLNRITIPPAAAVRVRFTWTAPAPGATHGSVTWSGETIGADGAITGSLPTWTNSSSDVPTSLGERVHMNLWLYRGAAPTDGKTVDVAISDFHWTPA